MIFSNLFSLYNSEHLNDISAKNTKGITLVALVVTIIVLLILAGVTITALVGDNAIIKKAMEGKQKTETGVQEKTEKINELLDEFDIIYNGDGSGDTPVDSTTPPSEPTTSNSHTIANLTSTTGKNYTWSELYNVSKAISQMENLADSVREITVKIGEKTFTVGIGDTATVYYDGATEAGAKTVRLIGFNHDTVVYSTTYGASRAGMTFEFVDFIGKYQMNGDPVNKTGSTNSGGWAAAEMREHLNGYNSKTTDNTKVGVKGGEAAKIKETSEGSALTIQKVKKDYLAIYNSANLNGGTSKALMSGTPTEDYLWLLSCAEIWNDGSGATGKGFAKGIEGSQYAFYKDISGLKYYTANNAIKKPSSSTALANGWWLRSPFCDDSSTFCYASSYCGGNSIYDNSYDLQWIAPGFSI